MVLGREANMQIEKQVCSLELSKELKECGYSQEGIWWIYNKLISKYSLTCALTQCIIDHPESWEYFIAPSVAELGEILPSEIDLGAGIDDKIYHLNCSKINQSLYTIGYLNRREKVTVLAHTEADTEANARAKMYIYLQKEGLI